MKEKKPLDGSNWDANLSQAVDLITSSNCFLFSGDIDPDSVGSMLSLSLYLKQLGKKVFLVIPGSIGENLDFFEEIINYNSISILRTREEIEAIKDEIEVVIFCDTPNTKLVPFYSFLEETILSRRPKVVEIDHHFGADSEQLTDYGIKLFRDANSNTEIIGTILETLHKGNPEWPNPFSQRNIILGLITGILGDTLGGEVIHHYKKDYDHWMDKLGERLKEVTRWRRSDQNRTEDCSTSKFGNPKQILQYLNKLSKEQEEFFNLVQSRIEIKGKVGFLNLLPSTYDEIGSTDQKFNSDRFIEIMGLLLNSVPQKSGHAGLVIFKGQNVEGEDCNFIKIRRSIDYSGVDLRKAEDKIKELFGKLCMGGGGHAAAVSFRIYPPSEEEFLIRLESLFTFLNNSIESNKI